MSKAQKSSASSPRVAPSRTKGDDTRTGRIVRYEVDPRNPPPLTDEQKKRLEALAKMSDDDIDFSDIPPSTEADWRGALRGLFSSPRIHLDSRVVAWFRRQIGEEGSLTEAVNHALLNYIAAEKAKARKKAG